MALIETIGWLVIATVALFATVAKLTKWSLNAEKQDVRVQHVNVVREMYKWLLVTVIALTFGAGVAQWLSTAFQTIIQVLPW